MELYVCSQYSRALIIIRTANYPNHCWYAKVTMYFRISGYYTEKFIIVNNKLFQVYVTCFYHVITCVCFFYFLYNCLDLLLKLFKAHFLNKLQYLVIIFSCVLDYLNSLINWTSLVPISSDNRRCAVYASMAWTGITLTLPSRFKFWGAELSQNDSMLLLAWWVYR